MASFPMRRGVGLIPVAFTLVALGTTPATAQSAAFAPALFKTQSPGIEKLTAGVQMTKDEQGPARGFSGPTSMVADPDNPRVIVAATADLRSRVCHLLRSTDGGHTWHFSKGLPAPTTYPYCTDASAGYAQSTIAWGRDGVVYYAMEVYGDKEGGFTQGHSSLAVARSSDLGDTWKTVLVDDERGKPEPAALDFGASVAVDTSGKQDAVYVVTSQNYPSAPPDSPLADGKIGVAVSTDGGVTFGPMTNVNDSAHLTRTINGKGYPMLMEGFFGAPQVIAHGGVAMVVSGSMNPGSNFPPGEKAKGTDSNFGTRFSYPMPQLVARTADQGKTWTMAEMGPPFYAPNGSQTGLGWTPKGGPNGTFVAAYAGLPDGAPNSGAGNVVVQRSTDMGKTWSNPAAIDQHAADEQFTSFYPQLSTAPNGRVDVVWQDTKGQSDYRVAVHYTYSADAGATWAPNVEVSDRPTDFNFGISFNSDIRQPPGVASTNYHAVVGWADTRFANETNQTQDDFSAAVQFSAIPAKSNTTLPIVAALFGGLVVAGLVLLIGFRIRRRGA